MRHFSRQIYPFVCAILGSCVSLALAGSAARAQKPTKTSVSALSTLKVRSAPPVPVAAQNGPRVALVVGCDAYGNNKLGTPRNDAKAVADALKNQGWDVETVTDTNSTALRAALRRLTNRLDKNSVGLFYFSGLGFISKGATYAIPIHVSLSDTMDTVLKASVSETEIADAMKAARSRVIILNGGRITSGGTGRLDLLSLAPTLPPNTLIAYDCKPGESGYEIGNQTLNPYAKHLTEALKQSGMAFVPLFERVGSLVQIDLETKQQPEFRHTFDTDFLVAASKSPVPIPVKPPVYVNNNPKPAPPIKPAPVVVTPDPVVPKPIVSNEVGQKWALLIGVEKYESDAITALNFTLRDVAALRRTLPVNGFAPNHILAMTSDLPPNSRDYPNNTNILKRINSLKNQLGEDDTLLIYFSGHGFQQQEGGQNYLGSVNADITNATLLKKSTISLEELRESLQGMDASQLILIMDCCRNNPFKNAGKGGSDTNARTPSFTRDLSLVSDSVSKKTGTAILFACQEGQRSWEDPDAQQGAFTVFLLEALKGKATRDGILTVTDLAGYIEKRMRDWCIQNNKDQRPDYEQHNRARIVLQEGPGAP